MKIENLNKTYNSCLENAKILEKNIDPELIKSLKNLAEQEISFINDIIKQTNKQSNNWTFIFRDYYEALRNLIEAYLLIKGIKSNNHQCKNAYICQKYPELILDWEFLETIRLKRNKINYEGRLITYDDWKQFKLKFNLHINILKKEIDEFIQ